MGLDPKYAEAPKVFFALHTYYALLIKLVASLAAARFAGGATWPLSEMAAKEGEDLRQAFADLEGGGIFKEYGIRNFLEGDFFGWYLAAWDDEIEDAVGELARRLAEYDPGTLELAPENARDLLKKLYHYLLPREIRHDLGEYYTPDWLAERLIIQTLGRADLGNPTKRVLDPACGSGTFLVILIKHIRERAARKKLDPAETLELTLHNVVGFDLNPLAVIAARTNYLLALGDLLKARRGDIDIPVYQADSVLTPSQGTGMFEGKTYKLRTSVGEFYVPVLFAERERMDALANTLDEAVETGIGEEAFLSRVKSATGLEDEEMEDAGSDLRALYGRLKTLHHEGLNGVWARIIKNAFAPLFIEPCHYVVGNPPWVNWENLPDDYRQTTVPLWEHYGLFPHGGMDTILGKGKKDISMLMTYVAADKYLRPRGRLGFVLTQSLFKTTGAGQGFRRFLLPDGTPFGPVAVEDMVELKSFEGATNRTAVAIFAKGKGVSYPVSYQYWKKKQSGRGSAIGFDTPYEDVTAEKITYRTWYAEPVDLDDATSSWVTGRRRAIGAMRKILGVSSYRAHEGANTGGASGVFWVEKIADRPGGLVIVSNITKTAKRAVAKVQAALEPDLLYPLLFQRDISKWSASVHSYILMVQDPITRRGLDRDVLQRRYPKTWAYISRFEEQLRARRALARYFAGRDEFWSMFDVGKYTFRPIKVVWPNMAKEIKAAVVTEKEGKPVVPQHIVTLLACETLVEAHYCCAAVNSSPFNFAVQSYSQKGGKSFGTPHILDYVRVPRYQAADQTHTKLAKLSEEAHEAAARGNADDIGEIESEIDRWAAKLWGLTDAELAEIKRSLQEA